MDSNNRNYRRILHAVRGVDAKCDRMLGILDKMLSGKDDSLLESIKESAMELYKSSLEERRRLGRNIGIVKHD